ncbi:aspartate aminotransferase family protein [Parazoarcus communis]|uniref:Aspartate aminotransferase family protein n=1 Tax=Parazoarcus communis SWub3 = DSM 12120 TaxID=1121029 RepID=A0A323UVV3_9RHOO|nr:aspartate aminotransferase family protein [Parazoarcus communis]NMG70435.1 aminotransferase class III-fold pyridoxal phosphate-dependent enzyme [Parazoarcus communis SWub3 = DSM 12120]PZA17142.1 aspartate aminotransferase family protein [Azoarcus communis] [Parazoarcus communis SWub3 = DSM 12120]
MNHDQAFWLPYTANRAFWKAPRVITGARGHYYTTDDGRQLLDGFSGLWTSGLGHCHPRIVAAVQAQVGTLDYGMGFQVSNDRAIALAAEVATMAPAGLERVFFTNSGSESADTALKIALAYHRARGEGQRTRLIGRERGYHGVNFGGMSVGGIPGNRKVFSAALLPGVDHIRHTYSPADMAYSRGQPVWGAQLAEDLERLVALHDASNIAALIVEPVSGSTGILVPPIGYLQRLREICDKYGILLIFDEVITAFGRVGAPFAAARFGVTPDIITTAKGLTNGVIPMGAVIVREQVYQALMQGPEHAVELFHGYTYSGHPVAAAAGLATFEVYREEDSFARARALEPVFEEAIHALKGEPHVVDIRNFGLMGGIELAPRAGAPGERGFEVFLKCFEAGVVIRNGGDILQFSPFLDSTPDELGRIFDTVRTALRSVA